MERYAILSVANEDSHPIEYMKSRTCFRLFFDYDD